MKSKQLIVPLLLLFRTLAIGQTVVASDAGRIETAEMRLDWTLGETVIGEGAAIGGVRLTNGFLQPRLTVEKALAADQAAAPLDLSIEVFPNPVSEKLAVQVRTLELAAVEVRLFDASGHEAQRWSQKTGAEPLEILMQPRSNGVYFLEFFSPDGQHIGSRKIIKSN